MFLLMGYIFSNILDARYKRVIFLDNEKYKFSTIRYRDENVLVIESNMTNGFRVLQNRIDLLTLQNLQTSIFETIESKKKITLPIVIQQFNKITKCMKKIFNQPNTVEDMTIKIRNIQYELIKCDIADKEPSFISQLI
jgi:hypothetical protein